MKTTKLTAIAIAIVFATTATMAQTDAASETAPNSDPQSFTVKFKSALQDRGLVYAMRTQLNPNFLQLEKPVYNVPVRHQKGIIIVTGTYKEWSNFFNVDDDLTSRAGYAKRIHLKEALLINSLTRAMREQLSPAMLRDEKPNYTAAVKFNRSVVYVTASYGEWKWFFKIDANSDPLGT